MTLQVWEQTISESFAGFEGLLQTISCFFAVSDVLDGFFFPHKMIIHVGNEMPQFLPTHFSTKASMETHVCQFYRYYHDRILLLFCQKHMLILKMGILHHLLSFSFKPLFIIFCSMAIEFFSSLHYLFPPGFFGFSSSQWHPRIKLPSDTGRTC